MGNTRLGFTIQRCGRRIQALKAAVLAFVGVQVCAAATPVCSDAVMVPDRRLSGSGTQALKELLGSEYMLAARARWLHGRR